MIKFGTEYGGYYLPTNIKLNEKSIVYSFGVGEDISFDVSLSSKFNCPIYMYDPTPRSIIHINDMKLFLENKKNIENNKRFGGGDPNYLHYIKNSGCNPNNLIFKPIGIYNTNTQLNFYLPYNEEYVSGSIENFGRNKNNSIQVDVKDIKTLMEENNHTYIDILKMDIENSEYLVLKNMFENNIYPKYICIDFDGLRTNYLDDNKKIEILEIIMEKYNILCNNNFDFTFYLKDL